MTPLEIEARIMTKFAELGGQPGDLLPDEALNELKGDESYMTAVETLAAQKLIIISEPSIELTTQGSEYVKNFLAQE